MENLGKRLKALREEKNLSQQQLAKKLQTTQNAIYRYEHDLAEPTLGLLVAYADFFHVTVDFLLNRKEDVVDDAEKERTLLALGWLLTKGEKGYDVLRQALLELLKDAEFLEELDQTLQEHKKLKTLVS